MMGSMRESANAILESARSKADGILSGCGDFGDVVGEDFLLKKIRDEDMLKRLMKAKVARGLLSDDQ
jgi:hypothetical protein